MNKKIFAGLLLIGLGSGAAQADLVLNNLSHTSTNVNQREVYFINSATAGSDNIFIQSYASTTPGFNDGATFMDGFLSVWQLAGSNWTLVGENDQAQRAGAGNTGGPGDTGPTTIFGQNVLGYVSAQPGSGLADPGLTLNLLANTDYAIVQSAGGAPGFNDVPNISVGQSIAYGTPLQNVFTGQDDLSGGSGTPYSYTNQYTLDVTGNVSQISQPVPPTSTSVPVPGAALWILGSVLSVFFLIKRQPACV